MDQEIVQGKSPWRNLSETSGKAATKGAQSVPSLAVPNQIPEPELFLPEQRQKLFQHLVHVQFPAIREMVAKVLEGGFFLLDPADVTLSVIRRVVVEADEYNQTTPYWDWVRSVTTVSIHEIVLPASSEEEPSSEENSETGETLRNQIMRRSFNRLPLEQRRALYHIAVMGQCLEDAARSTGEDPEDLRKHAREGLRKVLEGIESEERGDSHV